MNIPPQVPVVPEVVQLLKTRRRDNLPGLLDSKSLNELMIAVVAVGRTKRSVDVVEDDDDDGSAFL